MADYRRLRLAGRSYFLTVCLAARGGTLLWDRVDALRASYAAMARDHPVRCDAIAVLPDHLHVVWTLPEGDDDFPERVRLLKHRFTRAVPGGAPRASHRAKRERGIWQRRYWGERRPGAAPVGRVCRERAKPGPAQRGCIRDEAEWTAAVRYVWENPVKHGFVARPEDWPHSSAVGMRR